MGWLYRLVEVLYRLKDSEIDSCELVVPLGYGPNKDRTLSDATKKALSEAASLSLRCNVPIAWASPGSNYFGPGYKELEDQTKSDYLKSIGYPGKPVMAYDGISNSVTEARNIRATVIEKKIPCRKIVIVCEWAHARSAKRIWKLIFPDSNIMIKSIAASWNSNYQVKAMHSEFLWLIVNLVRHLALIVLGLDRVAKFQHPIDK